VANPWCDILSPPGGARFDTSSGRCGTAVRTRARRRIASRGIRGATGAALVVRAAVLPSHGVPRGRTDARAPALELSGAAARAITGDDRGTRLHHVPRFVGPRNSGPSMPLSAVASRGNASHGFYGRVVQTPH